MCKIYQQLADVFFYVVLNWSTYIRYEYERLVIKECMIVANFEANVKRHNKCYLKTKATRISLISSSLTTFSCIFCFSQTG
jgi:hypothetical protein